VEGVVITGIEVRGFKVFDQEGTGTVPLGRLTLILGPNSIGKSTLIQAILCVAQSWQHSPQGIMHLNTAGSLVDLGRFSKVLHRIGGTRSVDRVTIGIEAEKERISFVWTDGHSPSLDRDGLQEVGECRAGFLERITVTPREAGGLAEFAFVVRAGNEEVGEVPMILTLDSHGAKRWAESHPEHSQLLEPLWLNPVDGRSWALEWHLDNRTTTLSPRLVEHAGLAVPKVSTDLRGEGASRVCNVTLMAEALGKQIHSDPGAPGSLWSAASGALRAVYRLRMNLAACTYLCGLRDRGRRIYSVRTDDDPWQVGARGERIVDVMLAVPDTAVRTNSILEKAGIPYAVGLGDSGFVANSMELLLRTTNDGSSLGNELGLPDVGTGIAQLLPLAIQLAALQTRTVVPGQALVMVEQPELHLHPRMQVALANLLAEAVRPPQVSAVPELMVVAETHSEHLVRAVSNLVARGGVLEPEDVVLLAVERNSVSGKVCVERIPLDAGGRFLRRWPNDFFPERADLIRGKLP
jgi:hypothetical protein